MISKSLDVLVIGAGVAGMEASLLLSKAGRKVHLIERSSYTGGTSVLFEQVYPTFECATCMLSPLQQDLLQDPNIHLMALSEVTQVKESPQGFEVMIRTRARYVNPDACIGCGACFEPCPVTRPNEAEMGFNTRKAMYVPFSGTLPNVPRIDKEACIHLQGGECQKCKDACAFEAVDLDQKDADVPLSVASIIVATGSDMIDLKKLARYGYGAHSEVYSALEFERMFSSNGPTSGQIQMKNGKPPRSVALVHCVGREEVGYCSSVCCMYLLKFNQYLRNKLQDIEVHEYISDLTIPGQSAQHFFMRMMKGGTDLVRARDLRLTQTGDQLKVEYQDATGNDVLRPVDMVILAPALVPRKGADLLAGILGISLGTFGYNTEGRDGPVSTSRKGIFIIGGARGPEGIDTSVMDAYAAVAHVLGPQRDG